MIYKFLNKIIIQYIKSSWLKGWEGSIPNSKNRESGFVCKINHSNSIVFRFSNPVSSDFLNKLTPHGSKLMAHGSQPTALHLIACPKKAFVAFRFFAGRILFPKTITRLSPSIGLSGFRRCDLGRRFLFCDRPLVMIQCWVLGGRTCSYARKKLSRGYVVKNTPWW